MQRRNEASEDTDSTWSVDSGTNGTETKFYGLDLPHKKITSVQNGTIGKARFPDEAIASFGAHDGQRLGTPGIILPYARTHLPQPRYTFLSLQLMTTAWTGLCSAFVDAASTDGGHACVPGIQNAIWLPGWMPFAGNGLGDYLCIDLSPGPGGNYGQIIAFSHEKRDRPLLAHSLSEFLERLAQALEVGDQYCL